MAVREFVAFDLETTGLIAESDRVVEIGAVRFEASGRALARFERLVNPERPMSGAALAIHGISDAMLAGAPTARVVLPDFITFLGDPATTTLLAHNAAFDAGFLGRELARHGSPPPAHVIIDTLALARRMIPQARNHRLDTLARLLRLDPDRTHRALADSVRVKGLWLALGGNTLFNDNLIAYNIVDPLVEVASPSGWDLMRVAIAGGLRVRIEYSGGTHGDSPREVTPMRFVHRGGVPYLVALCHFDDFEKSFRLDRVVSHEIVAPAVLSKSEPSAG
jgi:DNA polymerase III epsilon subunit family exonuclease